MTRRERRDSNWVASERRRWLVVAGTVVVVGVLAVAAARTVEVGAVVDALARADPQLLAAAVAVYAVSWPLRGRRYADVLAAMGRRIDLRFLTLSIFASQAANLVLPARAGDGVRAYVCNARRDVPYATGAASLTVERAFDLLALAAIGGVALAAVVGDGGVSVAPVVDAASSVGPATGSASVWTAGLAGLGVLPLVGTLALVGALALRRWDAPANRIVSDLARRLPAGLVDGSRSFGRDLAAVASAPRSLAAVGAASFGVWALDALTAVLVLAAVAGTVDPSLLAVATLAVAAGNLAKVVPLTQGGLGLYEGAFAATVVALSPVAGAVALAAAVADHALKNLVTIAGGALAAILLGLSPGAAPAADAG